VKTGCNLAESSEEGYGSKKSCFANDNDTYALKRQDSGVGTVTTTGIGFSTGAGNIAVVQACSGCDITLSSCKMGKVRKKVN
jgi:hypothetical protein